MSDALRDKLQAVVNGADLEDKQKKLWELFTTIATEEEIEAVYEAVQEDEGSLKLLSENLRSKLLDMRERDPQTWEKLNIKKPKVVKALN